MRLPSWNVGSAFRLLFVLSATLVGLLACSGDPRALEEAVETRLLDLQSIVIAPGGNRLPVATVNPGERFELTVTGRDSADNPIALSADDRAWTVSDSSVASVDENGVFTARANGTVFVGLTIGSLEAPDLMIEVFQADAVAIQSITGPDVVNRCLPQSYQATALFDDDSTRALVSGVVWTLNSDAPAELLSAANGATQLNGQNAGVVTLTASLDALDFSRMVTIADTLRSLTIGPTVLSAQVGDTQDLTATATYEDVAVTSSLVTEFVNWSVPAGTDIISIDNSPPERGRVSASQVGTATVNAACGDVMDSRSYSVISSSSSSLSFQQSSPVQLFLSEPAPTQLRISTGSSYDADNDVTAGSATVWSLVDGSSSVLLLLTTGAAQGQVTPLNVGSATVRVTRNGVTADLAVQVNASR